MKYPECEECRQKLIEDLQTVDLDFDGDRNILCSVDALFKAWAQELFGEENEEMPVN